MGVTKSRTILYFLLCTLLVVGLTANAEAARRKTRKKDPVIVTPPTLLEKAQAVRGILEKRARDPQVPLPERARTALRIGALTPDNPDFDSLASVGTAEAAQLRIELLLQSYRFAEIPQALTDAAKFPANAESRWLDYRWRFVREDLRSIDSLSRAALIRDTNDVASQAARAELALRLLDFAGAEAQYRRLLAKHSDAPWRSRLNVGLSRVLYKQDRYQESLDTLLTLLDSTLLTDDALANIGLALIGLSRVNEAIELFDEAARWNPNNELAQYYLGNGYSRQNYSQLREKNDGMFAAETVPLNAEARRFYSIGDAQSAVQKCRDIAETNPKDVASRTLLGSILWEQGQFSEAADVFREVLSILPGYGRARNGLARSLEGTRFRQNIHRTNDEAAFAATGMPDVPRITEFVLNWTSLSPRHQKQVALAVAPWKAYLPVLIESGSRFYIKPLHELLSESPNLETIRDQRIDYDSRLWDDVRGCGGFTTVTGIEDVERSIFRGYNTVLHELTHQVHGVFPEIDSDRIRDLFHAARVREDRGQPTFMSRYQQSSVWEYFAEGANALFSPRRDSYDTRDIVRERLMERDTALAAVVQYYIAGPNLNACYPVGLVNAAENALEKQQTANALLFANKAVARAPRSEAVLGELLRIHSIMDEDSQALAFADSFIILHPQRSAAYTGKATAAFFHNGNNQARIDLLTRALAVVDSTERKLVRQALGDALWYDGRYPEAAQQYRGILAEVRDDPNALWGLGLALGDGGDMLGADSAFREALAQRSGIVELRLGYARILLQAGRWDDAGVQLEEAQLLARGDPILIALKGWYTFQRGNKKEALRLLDRAVQLAPEQRLPEILRLDVCRQFSLPKRRDPLKRDPPKKVAEKLSALSQTDIPMWIFQERTATYIHAREWPQFQRALLTKIAGSL
jgi:tetratricopeptide (TPR) repeat protein